MKGTHVCYDPPINKFIRAAKPPKRQYRCWICGKSTYACSEKERIKCNKGTKASESTGIHRRCLKLLQQRIPKKEYFTIPDDLNNCDCTFFLKCNEMAHKYMKDIIYPNSATAVQAMEILSDDEDADQNNNLND